MKSVIDPSELLSVASYQDNQRAKDDYKRMLVEDLEVQRLKKQLEHIKKQLVPSVSRLI